MNEKELKHYFKKNIALHLQSSVIKSRDKNVSDQASESKNEIQARYDMTKEELDQAKEAQLNLEA